MYHICTKQCHSLQGLTSHKQLCVKQSAVHNHKIIHFCKKIKKKYSKLWEHSCQVDPSLVLFTKLISWGHKPGRCFSKGSELSHCKHTIMCPALRGLLQCTPLVLRTQVWGSVTWGIIRQEIAEVTRLLGTSQMSLAVVHVHKKQLCLVPSQSTGHLCYWKQIAHHLWRVVMWPYKALIQKFLTGPQT